MKIKSIIYIILLVVVELLTVSSLKYWSENKNNFFLYFGLFGYLSVGGIFAYILNKHSEITIINNLWQVLNIILVSILGIVIYKEKLSTKQMVGVFLAIVATILLAIE